MVPKSGTQLPKSQISLSDAYLAELIARALQDDLGASRRATKTVMTWTGVSDHTARAWLNGRSSPSGVHLVLLAAHCRSVMSTVLRLTGHDDAALWIDLEAMEIGLEKLLTATRQLRSYGR
jgi:hypothetical protein